MDSRNGAFHDRDQTKDTAPPRIELTRFAPCRKRVCFRRFNLRKLKIATLAATNSLARDKALLLFFCILLGGCHSWQRHINPSIEFTRVPAADLGGPDQIDTIEGRATGVRQGQQVVLCAKSDGLWWVQPFADHPFTKVQNDSKILTTAELLTGLRDE
jgi:hypothetical protein